MNAALDQYAEIMADVNPRLRGFVYEIGRQINGLQAASGQSLDPPQQALFTVQGVDGKFLITIVNPQDILPQTATQMRAMANAGNNDAGISILHNVQSSTDLKFNNASSIKDYGISSQLSYEIQDPNQNYYWRMRSSYDGQNWNDWQLFIDPTQCGPVTVASGFLRSEAAALAAVFNQTNFAFVDSINSGTDATIRVFGIGGPGSAWTRPTVNGSSVRAAGPYVAALLLHFAYGTDYFVAYDTAANNYIVSLTLPPTLLDTVIPVGKVTTVSPGVAVSATAIAQLAGTTIASATVNNGGAGYATPPTVVISGGGGSGATATATVGAGVVTGITITNAGTGYTSQPTIQFFGGGGAGAVATANLTPTSVASIILTNGGSGYSSDPTVNLAGGGGAGATATASVSGGAVSSVNLTAGGANYTSAPTVSFTGGADGQSGGGQTDGDLSGRYYLNNVD